MGPMGVFKNPLVKSYIRGEDIKRPFAAPENPLSALYYLIKDEYLTLLLEWVEEEHNLQIPPPLRHHQKKFLLVLKKSLSNLNLPNLLPKNQKRARKMINLRSHRGHGEYIHSFFPFHTA